MNDPTRGYRRPIGEILIAQGLATPADIDKALDLQRQGDPRPLGQIILAITEVGTDQVVRSLAKQFDMEFVDLDKAPIDPSAVALVTRDFAWQNILLPFRYEFNMLYVAVFDPIYNEPLAEIQRGTGLKVHAVLATIEALDRALNRVYRGSPMQPSPMRPPPLFERKEDLRRLIGLFLKDFSSQSGRMMKVSRMALGALLSYPWKSVRELMDVMEASSRKSGSDVIRIEHLPAQFQKYSVNMAAESNQET